MSTLNTLQYSIWKFSLPQTRKLENVGTNHGRQTQTNIAGPCAILEWARPPMYSTARCEVMARCQSDAGLVNCLMPIIPRDMGSVLEPAWKYIILDQGRRGGGRSGILLWSTHALLFLVIAFKRLSLYNTDPCCSLERWRAHQDNHILA